MSANQIITSRLVLRWKPLDDGQRPVTECAVVCPSLQNTLASTG